MIAFSQTAKAELIFHYDDIFLRQGPRLPSLSSTPSAAVIHKWLLVIRLNLIEPRGLLRWLSSKEFTCQFRRHKRHGFDPWVWKIPWRRKWRPTPVFLPGKSHGQKSLVGYSPWGLKELDSSSNTPEPLLKGPALLTSIWKHVTVLIS